MASHIKIILAGNPGRGKSTIGNALLSANVFEEGTAPEAVTKNVAFSERTLDSGQQVIVYDTPGLHDANAKNFHRNAACFAQAVKDRESLPTVVLFVASAPRVSAEDVAAFRSIFRCVVVNPAAILVVINKVEIDENSIDKFVVDFERTFRAAVAAGDLGLRVAAGFVATRFVSVPHLHPSTRPQRLPHIAWQLLLPTLKHARPVTMLQRIMSEEEELQQRKQRLEAEEQRQRAAREEERRRQREREEQLRQEEQQAEERRRREQDERERLRREAEAQAAEARRLRREAEAQAAEARRLQEEVERRRERFRHQPMVLVHGPYGPMLVPAQHVMGGLMFHPGLGGGIMHPGFGGFY